ncbi:MAG: hypothetical protein F6J94_00210 [Moorea sp. SIO1F2]|uniref:hypothetical protein n=1 Tax=Moorena sp. SIO1F2 TaxID=2607819 RepID=UPI0013BC3410|nr:hypothetical protein [Moorena sp. SIO1F2]NET80467.1 hypothetical protein [Moorena sp. SIO1F2]
MKSILKIFSSLLLTFTLFLGFTGAASAYGYPECDLVNDYFCPPENLDVYDVEIVELPSFNTVIVEIAPFVPDIPYYVNYQLGTEKDPNKECVNICEIVAPTEGTDLGFVQNVSVDYPQIIDVSISKLR